jgi:hypothetical protein
MCIYICLCVCVCIYICVCLCLCVCIYIFIYLFIYVFIYLCMCFFKKMPSGNQTLQWKILFLKMNFPFKRQFVKVFLLL